MFHLHNQNTNDLFQDGKPAGGDSSKWKSTKIGNNVSIGGQAGISGHLIIGNNVKIGGGSGVVKDISDNQIVMGYPAVSIKDFLRNLKKWVLKK